jgi:hypothetical protein
MAIGLVIALVVGFAVVSKENSRIDQGRKEALTFTCAVLSAVTESGREVLFQEVVQLPNGTKTPVQAIQQGEIIANHYVRRISDLVADQIGQMRARVIKPNGSINCVAVKHFALVP